MSLEYELVIKMKLYHGSDKSFRVIQPIGINMGHRFAKPRYSSYFWRTYELAFKWAIFQTLRRSKVVKTGYHIPDGKGFVVPEDLDTSVDYLTGKFVYVYEANINPLLIGVGSSPEIDEFTVDKDVTPDKIYRVKLTSQLVSDNIISMTDSEKKEYIDEIRSGKYSRRRGLLLSLLLDKDRDLLRNDPKVIEQLEKEKKRKLYHY